MVDPLTLSLLSLGVVGITSLYHLVSAICDAYRNRFKHYTMMCYREQAAQYPTLWAMLSHPDHVSNPLVRRRDQRKASPTAQSVEMITQAACFRFDCRAGTLEWTHRMRIRHERHEDGGMCIRVFCLTNEELVFFRELIDAKTTPDAFVLVECST